jgi:hypothetical protein
MFENHVNRDRILGICSSACAQSKIVRQGESPVGERVPLRFFAETIIPRMHPRIIIPRMHPHMQPAGGACGGAANGGGRSGRRALLALTAVLANGGAAAPGGTTALGAPPHGPPGPPTSSPPRTLWNGVSLPPVWPPNAALNRSVVAPGYLRDGPPNAGARPAAVNVTVGRQLFVDGFLVASQSGLKTAWHAPTCALLLCLCSRARSCRVPRRRCSWPVLLRCMCCGCAPRGLTAVRAAVLAIPPGLEPPHRPQMPEASGACCTPALQTTRGVPLSRRPSRGSWRRARTTVALPRRSPVARSTTRPRGATSCSTSVATTSAWPTPPTRWPGPSPTWTRRSRSAGTATVRARAPPPV